MKEQAISPRLALNERLYKDFMARNRIKSAYPAVYDQIASVQVNRRALSKYGYNPSLIRENGKLLMAYRWHPKNTPQTALAIATLDDNLNVLSNNQVTVATQRGSDEDPRLFIHKGSLWVSYVDSTWPDRPPKCVIKYGKLVRNPWRVEGDFQINYGANDGTSMEKNWVFFSHEDRLYVIYQCEPEHVVLEVSGNDVVKIHKSAPAVWPWGIIRGGTSPMRFGESWVRFFHSGLDYDPPPYYRRYYVGAMTMQPRPPFKVDWVSTKPIVRGSEICSLSQEESASCSHYKGNVVFPAGGVEGDGEWLVSCGINDSTCVVIKPSVADLT